MIAMQQKPEADRSRKPNDLFAGFGFSKSMPDSAIREKLILNKVKNESRPQTHYEVNM